MGKVTFLRRHVTIALIFEATVIVRSLRTTGFFFLHRHDREQFTVSTYPNGDAGYEYDSSMTH